MLLTVLYIVGFLRALLFFVFIYLIVRWLRKIFSPGTQKTQNFSNRDEPREGETTIRFDKKGEKIVDKNKGEYVDFEEVE